MTKDHHVTAALRSSLTVFCPRNENGFRDVFHELNVFVGEPVTLHQVIDPRGDNLMAMIVSKNPIEEARFQMTLHPLTKGAS